MVWTGIYWSKLKRDSPVNLDRVVSLARKIELNLTFRGDLNKDREKILEARSQIDTLISIFISLLQDSEIVKEKSDKMIFLKLQEDIGRMLKFLDEFEQKNIRETKITYLQLNLYKTQLETMLYRDIFFVLEKAIKECKKEKKRFLYLVYKSISLNAGIFGSSSRDKSKKGSMDTSFTSSVDDLTSEDGQEKLKNEFEQEIEKMKATDKLGKNK